MTESVMNRETELERLVRLVSVEANPTNLKGHVLDLLAELGAIASTPEQKAEFWSRLERARF